MGDLNCTGSKPILEGIYLNVQDMRPRIIDMHFNQAMGILTPRLSPDEALRKQHIMARNSQPWMSTSTDIASLTRIAEWIFCSKSSLLVIEAPKMAETKAKEIVTELIGMLRPPARRICWYLSTTSSTDHHNAIVDILKGLIHQLIRFDPENIHRILDGNLTATRLQQDHSEQEWTDLLYIILKHLSDCYIVVEGEDVFKLMGQDARYLERLLEIFRPLVTRASEEGFRVKLLLVGYGRSPQAIASSAEDPFMSMIHLRASVPIPANRRRGGARPAFQTPMWLNLRTRVMKRS